MNSQKQFKKNNKSNKKNLKYKQKDICQEWTCTVCNSINNQINIYCLNCLQTIYYYNYINKHMFVQKDESYLAAYESTPMKRKYSAYSESTNNSECEESQFLCFDQPFGNAKQRQLNMKWVDNLLQG